MTTATTDIATATAAATLAPAKTPPPSGTPAAPAPPGAQVKPISGCWPRFETWPWLHSFVQTTIGRLALILVFSGFMSITHVKNWYSVSLILTMLTFLPRYRRQVLMAAALGWAMVQVPQISDPTTVSDMMPRVMLRHDAAAMFAALPFRAAQIIYVLWPLAVALLAWTIGYTYIRAVQRHPKSFIGRRPITGVMLILTAVMTLQGFLGGLSWVIVATFCMALSHYIWFFCYAVIEPKQKNGTPANIRPEYWRYFWATNRCPIGKGPSYLDRIEARNDAELATVQLKALKLIIWVAVLAMVRVFYTKTLYGSAAESQSFGWWHPPGLIPTYNIALDSHLAGHPFPWAIRWCTLISHFLLNLLELSIWGHKLIAVARMAGYNAFRMTYKPLGATSIAEFFNRVHWYLKEMLGTFFFFPTYLRYFKKHPRVRVFFATMAAAGFGNFFYHFFAYDRHVYEKGIGHALISYHCYAIYAVILGTAIGISQIRILGKKKTTPTGWRKARAIAGVLFFYCLLTIFDAEIRRDLTIADYTSFFFSLFRP